MLLALQTPILDADVIHDICCDVLVRDAPPRRSSCGVSTISSCTIVELVQFTQVSMLIIVVLIIVFVYRTQPCGNSENRHQTAGYNLLWMLSGINTEMSLEDGSRVASTVSSGHEDAPSD